jgi:hypothetical protein
MIIPLIEYFGLTGFGFIMGYMFVEQSTALKERIGSPFVGGLIGGGIGFALTICAFLFILSG